MVHAMHRDPDGHYARLGLAPSASPAAIVAAWRRQARRLHPDVPDTGDADAFLALKTAYDVLHDPARRAAYDEAASMPAAPPRPGPPRVGRPRTDRRRARPGRPSQRPTAGSDFGSAS